ncbi:hypothetical protein GCM10028817_21730 [Spirosoma pomorum]
MLGIGAVATLVNKAKRKVLRYPVANPKITSGYGERTHPITGVKSFHNGIDLAGTIGTVIAAPADGVVTGVNVTATGGNQLFIRHDNGFTTGYAHLQMSLVAVGARVITSQVIARMGNTGQSTGPHLHFTVRDQSGQHVNPVDYLY